MYGSPWIKYVFPDDTVGLKTKQVRISPGCFMVAIGDHDDCNGNVNCIGCKYYDYEDNMWIHSTKDSGVTEYVSRFLPHDLEQDVCGIHVFPRPKGVEDQKRKVKDCAIRSDKDSC